MLNNANRRQGYTEVYYNYRTRKYFTEQPGAQFLQLDIQTNGGGDNPVNPDNYMQQGDNISLLANDANYVSSGADVSVFINDAAYVSSGANVSVFTNDAEYLVPADNVSLLTNDAGYLTTSVNISEFPNDANYVAEGDNISVLTNNAAYLASGDNVSALTNDAAYVTSADIPTDNSELTNGAGYITVNQVPPASAILTVDELPAEADSAFGDLLALTTDGFPYFYDGNDWRKIYLYGVPADDPEPDSDWDIVCSRITFDDQNVYDYKTGTYNDWSGAKFPGAPKRFGNCSCKCFSGDFFMIGDLPNDYLDGAWTIEFWMFFDSLPTNSNTQYDIIKKGDWHFCWEKVGSNYTFYQTIGEEGEAGYERLEFGRYTLPNNQKEWLWFVLERDPDDGEVQLFINCEPFNAVSGNSIDDSSSTSRVTFFGDTVSERGNYYFDDVRCSTTMRYQKNAYIPEIPTSAFPIAGEE